MTSSADRSGSLAGKHVRMRVNQDPPSGPCLFSLDTGNRRDRCKVLLLY